MKNDFIKDDLAKSGDESVAELLSSIRQIVYPAAYTADIVDLNSTTNDIHCNEETLLSEKSFLEAKQAMSSYIQTVKSPASEKTVQSFLAELLVAPLNNAIADNLEMISSIIEEHIKTQLPLILKQWLSQHLPSIVLECVERQLKLIHEACNQ